MKKGIIFYLVTILIVGSMAVLQQSCQKSDVNEDEILYITASLSRLEMRHDLYYRIHYNERSIELDFSQSINTMTVDGNIKLSDNTGDLSTNYDVEVSGQKLMIMFHDDFQLRGGWRYFLTINTGLKSSSGLSLEQNKTFELRTMAKHFFDMDGPDMRGKNVGSQSQRNTIACISDIHMGDQRAVSNNYCWFGDNAEALEHFLDYVIDSNHVKELVILGDMFDEWLVPYTISPIDPQVGINNTKEYFQAVAGSETNIKIFDKLKAIAQHDSIDLIYVPGNHDMLIEKEMIEEIIPKIIWKGDVSGLGKYEPVDGFIMEHGHRYDFFNCPQPLVNSGHMLPPGYFVSRLYAQGMMDHGGNPYKGAVTTSGSFEFLAAWDVAYLYTIAHWLMPFPNANHNNILMGGIDGYNDAFSFNGARDMYAADIEDLWNETQTGNKVPVNTECCFHAIWNGHSDLFGAAKTEYLEQPPAPGDLFRRRGCRIRLPHDQPPALPRTADLHHQSRRG